ncbi:hypothetical protein GOODEAATRI_007556 [Goodea atripinnis]|uniref:Uncharacterized protein n=1 Tax=Goodea atripinnis TaxID=208336 RepID=A0ABV0NIA8_9TELE
MRGQQRLEGTRVAAHLASLPGRSNANISPQCFLVIDRVKPRSRCVCSVESLTIPIIYQHHKHSPAPKQILTSETAPASPANQSPASPELSVGTALLEKAEIRLSASETLPPFLLFEGAKEPRHHLRGVFTSLTRTDSKSKLALPFSIMIREKNNKEWLEES